MNIGIYPYNKFDTNECPNKYSNWELYEYSNIFEYSNSSYTLTHSRTNIRIYSYNQIWRERMSEYIRIKKIDTNEYPDKYLWQIYLKIWIFEYICHTLVTIKLQRSQGFRAGTRRYFAKSRDPKIFRDGISLLFSSRDWWDPRIFLDGISQTLNPGIFWKKMVWKPRKVLESIVLFDI